MLGHSECPVSIVALLTKRCLALSATPSIASVVPLLPTMWMTLTLSIGKIETEWERFREKQQKKIRERRGLMYVER